MKYDKISKWLLMAVVMMTTVSLTACGGDDDDEIFNEPPEKPITTEYQYIEPCLDWGLLRTDVKAVMAKGGWSLVTDATYLEYSDITQTTAETWRIYYAFFGGTVQEGQEGLQYVRVTYHKYTEDFWKWLVKETERRYNVTLTMDTEYSNETMGGGDGETVINGQPVHVSMMYSTGAVAVSFILM